MSYVSIRGASGSINFSDVNVVLRTGEALSLLRRLSDPKRRRRRLVSPGAVVSTIE